MSTRRRSEPTLLEDDPLWYKDAIIYELHVRAFADSNSDGIGDLGGLVHKLDYLQDLGVTTLWLLPLYPSPLKDDGYDIADYTSINPIYGDLGDFKTLLREAHRRGLRVITELVVNHTSDQHPWFQRARRAAAGTRWRDFYVWSDTAERYKDARIIFSDFESSNWSWDPLAKAYYWHRFYSHQPDLNYDNPAVHEAVFAALDFWLRLGIDGVRLDAVPYLYEREGTNCENLPPTHEFLRKLRKHVDEHFRNRLLLAEANQWPEDAVAYFGAGDECHMAFHFPLMPRLFMGILMEDRFPILDILQQTPAIPDSSQWALFLRNHDELTLEMVTDEDRDYMYRVYAQDPHARVNLGIRRRLAPLLGNHRGKIELMNALLFSLPGTPVIYYGDEIGMGDNIYLGDRNGVRTPMQWNSERNAGFSAANPQRLFLPVIIDPEYHYQTTNVEAQQNNPHSLLWWMKRLIALRKRHQALGRGTLEFLAPDNRKVLAFLRRYQQENILVVANLSRFVQYVELDLAAFKGMVPVEMLGRTALPGIGDHPYLLTLSPYAFYWLSLEPRRTPVPLPAGGAVELPALEVTGTWHNVLHGKMRHELERVLLGYLQRQRWFTRKGGEPQSARITQQIPVPSAKEAAQLLLVQVEYTEGEPRTFVVPLAFAIAAHLEQLQQHAAHAIIARLQVSGHGKEAGTGCLVDALVEPSFATALLDVIARQRHLRGDHANELVGWSKAAFRQLRAQGGPSPEPVLIKGERDNTLVAYGDRLVLKLFRSVEEGGHPELELGEYLVERKSFMHAAPVAGALELRNGRQEGTVLAALVGYVPHEGDAWDYTVDALRRYFATMLARQPAHEEPALPSQSFLDLATSDPPPLVAELIGPYLELARLMGQRTAELHIALASETEDAQFVPEPFSILHQRSLYQTARTRAFRVFELLREHGKELSEAARHDAQQLQTRKADLLAQLRSIISRRLTAQRIRCHGDYQLENLLFTGKDFVVTDFEGEAFRPLSNRRHKRSPLRDVATLMHSLYLAVRTTLNKERPEDRPTLEPWARYWHIWVCAAFMKRYLEVASPASFLPKTREELLLLFDHYILSRGLAELRYQLLNHPERAQIPMQAILQFLERRERRHEEKKS